MPLAGKDLTNPNELIDYCILLRSLAGVYLAAGRAADSNRLTEESVRRYEELIRAAGPSREFLLQAADLLRKGAGGARSDHHSSESSPA